MDSKYDKMVASMREKRSDDLFDPSELNTLTEDQRKKVEYEIVFNILYGNSAFFQYIPHLETFEAKDIKDKMDYSTLSDTSIIAFDSQIYRVTTNLNDLDKIIPMANENQLAFCNLAQIYKFNEERDLKKNNEQLLPHLKRCIENECNTNYETIFSNEVFKQK